MLPPAIAVDLYVGISNDGEKNMNAQKARIDELDREDVVIFENLLALIIEASSSVSVLDKNFKVLEDMARTESSRVSFSNLTSFISSS